MPGNGASASRRSTESVTVAVVDAIAAAENRDPTELDLVLEDHIDTEALDRTAARDAAPWTLSFETPDHDVTVTGDGLVLVDGREDGVALTR